MKRTIVDLTKPKPVTLPKPIVLTQCLQDSYGNKHFSGGDFTTFLQTGNSITRIANLTDGNKYASFSTKDGDLILIDGILFLGQWNDGVVA